MRKIRLPRVAAILPLILTLLSPLIARGQDETALDRYIAAPDPAYQYKIVSTTRKTGHTIFLVEMTSQSWRTEKEVDRPLWKHWLWVVKPDTLKSSKALILISGGTNDRPAPRAPNAALVATAIATGTVTAEIGLVPNEPLRFTDENRDRSEDNIIAYSWEKFLRGGDDKWPLRLPMTKSVVRAMDTVVAICSSPEGGSAKVDSFVVTGASKRGWTTWSTAAVDKRVVAIIPIVIDHLNTEPSLVHQFEAYGFFGQALKPYTDMKIPDWTGTAPFRALMKIEDPYEYRRRLTMPKFLINATGDQFFMLDSSRFYFDDLPGTKYLRYVPNADHSLKGSDAMAMVLTLYRAVVDAAPLPRFSWTVQADGAIRVTTDDQPTKVKLWQATNPESRDFRIESLGPVWKSTELAPQADGTYTANVPAPAKGWSAFLVELTYPSPGPAPYTFTTQVRIVPDTLPHKFQRKAAP